MKLITRNTDYAIRAICVMSNHKGDLVTVPQLVKELKIPRPFLRKILQTLGKSGIIKSYKGAGGGFSLERDPAKILLLDMINIFQGPFTFNECFFKRSLCPERGTCALKKEIDRIGTHVLSELKGIRMSDIIKGEDKRWRSAR